MPALANPRHEAFCQAYVRGKTAGNATASYIAAGFGSKGRAAGVSASKLLKQAGIASRIGEIQAQVASIEEKAVEAAAQRLGITKEKILAELAKLGLSNMLDYVRPQADGTVKVDLAALDRDTAAAIQEVTVDTFVEGRGEDAQAVRRVKFKLCDKRAALVDLGKHLGLFVGAPLAEQNINVNVKAELVDRPPRETYEEWNARRQRELAGKERLNKPKEGKRK